MFPMQLVFPLFLCFIKSVTSVKYQSIYVDFGSNLGTTIPTRIQLLFSQTNSTVRNWTNDSALDSNSLVIGFGNSSLSLEFLSMDNVKSEGYTLSVSKFTSDSTLIVCNGAPINENGLSYALNVNNVHYGAVVAAYAVLEKLGFAFLHPLAPYIPHSIEATLSSEIITENPYWAKRTWHIHTMHPLEFTEVLNGFDIPMFSKDNSKCLSNYCESWNDMFSTLSGLMEWLVANKQNRLEALLLGSKKWDEWNELTSGEERKARLKQINGLAHEYGILIGADIPIAFLQQHAWAMVNTRDELAVQQQDIKARIDWAFEADYDFISTEAGLSEFTKPSCDLMLELFNTFTSHGMSQLCLRFNMLI